MGHLRSNVARSEQVLERLVNRDALTEAGKEWIIAAFDPFHDREINCTGYPDANGSQSMLSVITLTAQISAPTTGLSATDLWDCHIIDWPFLGPLGIKQSCQNYTTTAGGGNSARNIFFENNTSVLTNAFGGLGYYSSKTADNNNDPFGPQNLSVANITPLAQDFKDNYRVVGKGFEVYNTSPELYKSGSVCVYKQPISDYMNSSTASIVSTDAPAFYGAADVLLMDAPPATVSEALRLPNSRQWAASEGCYVISPVHHGEIPVHAANWTLPMYYKDTPTDVTMYGPVCGVTTFGPFGGLTPTTGVLSLADQHFTNFDQCGAIFQGLTQQSTLTVNYRLFVEVFPGSSSPLSNYSKPSPEYDPVALKLYAEICHKSPVGVEVKFNGLGDWFIDGINAVKDMVAPIAAPILKQMKHPAAQALGALLKGKKNKTITGKGKNIPNAPKISAAMRENQKVKAGYTKKVKGKG